LQLLLYFLFWRIPVPVPGTGEVHLYRYNTSKLLPHAGQKIFIYIWKLNSTKRIHGTGIYSIEDKNSSHTPAFLIYYNIRQNPIIFIWHTFLARISL
jgi:hypothetical protein